MLMYRIDYLIFNVLMIYIKGVLRKLNGVGLNRTKERMAA